MGNSSSASKVSATMSVPSADHRLDEIRLSYQRVTCCGRSTKTIAAFTFPLCGLHEPKGAFVYSSVKAASVRLDKLSRMNPGTSVRVSGLAGGVTVFRVSLLLKHLLEALTDGARGERASSLNFTVEQIRPLDGEPVSSPLCLRGPARLLYSTSGRYNYGLYCNGRLWGEYGSAQQGYLRQAVMEEENKALTDDRSSKISSTETPARDDKSSKNSRTETPAPEDKNSKNLRTQLIPAGSMAQPRSLDDSETFFVRLIVHRIDDFFYFKEMFPDIYVKARMKIPLGKWCRTDVHNNCILSRALFEYRLVMAPFTYPIRRRRMGIRRRWRRPSPYLEVVMMDEDRFTRDDELGSIVLNLNALILPDDRDNCGVVTLSNETVNLFNSSEVRRVRSKNAVFKRELTGYWPLLKKKLRKELKSVGSILLTIQLLKAKEAAKYPAMAGNRDCSGNRFPTLAKPKREHGRFKDKVFFGPLQNVELAIAYITGIPNFRVFTVVVVVVAFLVLYVKPEHLTAFAESVNTTMVTNKSSSTRT